MLSNYQTIQFKSKLAPIINQFIKEKQACGCKYKEGIRIAKHFDSFLCNTDIKQNELPKTIVSQWLVKQPDEPPAIYQVRVRLVRQLGEFMVELNYPAYIVPRCFGAPLSPVFTPYIFTRKEINKLIHAVDNIKPNSLSPTRHIIMPEIFRLLYGCGFRINEVLNLRVCDVDLKQGVITVRDGKFGKDRLVPPSVDLIKRLQIYEEQIEKNTLEKRTDESFFFPSPKQTAWNYRTIYDMFRKLLHQCGICHGGRGKGPRLHDLRHTFAVHKLLKWYEEGCNLNAKLPLLVTYLGHKDFTGTQKYLHLTAELFPNLTARMNKQFGIVIPKRTQS